MGSRRSLIGEHAHIRSDTDFQLPLRVDLLPSLGSGLGSPVLAALIDPFGVSLPKSAVVS